MLLEVFHGSTSLLNRIKIEKGRPYKDFGCGFYVTESREHAKKLALRNKRIEIERFGKHCEAYLYTYEFDLSGLEGFKVKEFIDADFEWVQFVLANRKVRDRAHDYDVVMGPTADDDTMIVINAYLDGLYGVVSSENALSILLKNIEAENLPRQIYFSTDESANLLIQKAQVVRL